MNKSELAEQLIAQLLLENPQERLSALRLDDPKLTERKVLDWAKSTQSLLKSVPSHPSFGIAWEKSSELFRELILKVRLEKHRG